MLALRRVHLAKIVGHAQKEIAAHNGSVHVFDIVGGGGSVKRFLTVENVGNFQACGESAESFGHTVDSPLVIDVGRRGDCIAVQNNLNPLKSSMPATGTGLQTLRDRYSMIYGKEIFVVKTENSFVVELPLIPKDYESADN